MDSSSTGTVTMADAVKLAQGRPAETLALAARVGWRLASARSDQCSSRALGVDPAMKAAYMEKASELATWGKTLHTMSVFLGGEPGMSVKTVAISAARPAVVRVWSRRIVAALADLPKPVLKAAQADSAIVLDGTVEAVRVDNVLRELLAAIGEASPDIRQPTASQVGAAPPKPSVQVRKYVGPVRSKAPTARRGMPASSSSGQLRTGVAAAVADGLAPVKDAVAKVTQLEGRVQHLEGQNPGAPRVRRAALASKAEGTLAVLEELEKFLELVSKDREALEVTVDRLIAVVYRYDSTLADGLEESKKLPTSELVDTIRAAIERIRQEISAPSFELTEMLAGLIAYAADRGLAWQGKLDAVVARRTVAALEEQLRIAEDGALNAHPSMRSAFIGKAEQVRRAIAAHEHRQEEKHG